ncbi:hypothetical protein C9I98_09575 [Photobacterium sanctipauli]|uniref:Uncharacterized protein n=2 Tax=Photobacterium sanctipauli TaxID=1342794 RepID=A0A2T3NVN0_9GAMM|nr:hypothetical protein C9I98_09575 [Photobacterium sanctipauli]
MDFFLYLMGTESIPPESALYWLLALHDLVISTVVFGGVIFTAFKLGALKQFDWPTVLILQLPITIGFTYIMGAPFSFIHHYAAQMTMVTLLVGSAFIWLKLIVESVKQRAIL